MNPPSVLLAHFRAMRPRQWTKNAVVAAAYLFARGDPAQTLPPHAPWITLAVMACFCMASSAIYLINDVRDLELDRIHPTKRFRPIAAGRVKIPTALALAAGLATLSVGGALLVAPAAGCVVGLYLLKQSAYSLGLKKIAYLDVILIATGFVLRALAGVLALGPGVTLSHWLLICTFLLALFLGFCKRRHEKVTLGDLNDNARPSLRQVSSRVLDSLILLIAGATVTAYALYTVDPVTIAKFGGRKLFLTLPLVVAGLWRYHLLVYQREEGGRPEKILTTDPLMVGIVAAYGLVVLLLLPR